MTLPSFNTRPWKDDCEALEPTENHYADYVGWERWFGRQDEIHGWPDSGVILDALECDQRIVLYSIMCSMFADAVEMAKGPDPWDNVKGGA